ncbi:polysaccharide lyase 6 family protein [Actinopolymorpha alba]|uniref:polysaccharide lyase 6 family protein n=1 Tax=Actinopolymorpha alba TaxID=533267 RepID=UPI0003719B85|nr:polysaccharide lyase 6 family protein [Actinopolymorpha alba]
MLRRTFLLSAAGVTSGATLGSVTATSAGNPAAAESSGTTPATQVPPAATTVRVRSLADLQAAIDTAGPGDRIELNNGTYTASAPIRISGKSGLPGAPLTIAAQEVGRVTITGTAGFTIDASEYVTLDGFRLTHSSTLRVPANSHHIRFTRNHIELTAAAAGNHWLNIDGNNCEIGYNTFTNRYNQGVWVSIAGPSDGIAQHTWIHHNFFYNHRFDGSNGGEPIRLGLSHKQSYSAYAVIEHNLFEKVDGDPEAISVKSRDNIVQFNTIVDSVGSIVLRHGHRNRVEGNILLGGRSGIRFYGKDHVIVNNLVSGSTGTGLAVGSGNIEEDTASTGNEQVDRVLIAFNTFAGNATSVAGEAQRPLGPRDCVVANNIITGSGAQLITLPQGSQGFRWEGNILHSAPAGDIPEGGYRAVDPRLVEDRYAMPRIGASSPAVNAAVGSYPTVTLDIDLRARSGVKDVGADELSDGPLRRPLTRADVGPHARPKRP